MSRHNGPDYGKDFIGDTKETKVNNHISLLHFMKVAGYTDREAIIRLHAAWQKEKNRETQTNDTGIHDCEKSHKDGKTNSNSEKDKYSFTVTNPDQVDVERIIKENPEAKVITISLHGSASVLVLIRKSLASKFNMSDELFLGDKRVCPQMPDIYQYDEWINHWRVDYLKDMSLKDHPSLNQEWFYANGFQPKVFEQIERLLNAKKISVKVRTW